MDSKLEELQFLGVFGVYCEAYKLLLSRRRIFSQIIAAFILPLSAAYLAHVAISAVLFANISRDMEAIADAGSSSVSASAPAQSRRLQSSLSEWTAVILFNAAYLLVVLIFSLLSTSTVVYTVACAYTTKQDVTFSEVIAVVPKVWKRLILTFIWNLLYVVSVVILVGGWSTAAGVAVLAVFIIDHAAGIVYVSVVWQVASVVSVLEEDCCSLAATRKSSELLIGKQWLAVVMFVMTGVPLAVMEVGFRVLVVENAASGAAARVGYGAAVLSLLAGLMVVGQVVQAVVYLVCKSYHHESIDKSTLPDLLVSTSLPQATGKQMISI